MAVTGAVSPAVRAQQYACDLFENNKRWRVPRAIPRDDVEVWRRQNVFGLIAFLENKVRLDRLFYFFFFFENFWKFLSIKINFYKYGYLFLENKQKKLFLKKSYFLYIL